MPGRKYAGNSTYRYGFNGQEHSSELNDNLFTAQYWEYDGRTGKRWNSDPRPNTSISPYATFNNNPIWLSDRFGDSSVIDTKGYILHYDANDKDLRVFMQNGKQQILVGQLGKDIDASVWLKNLLQENSKSADDLMDPALFGDNFKTRVQQYGIWDYKYRSPANENEETSKLSHHILGIAFYRKDKEKGVGDLPETYFTFDGNRGRAEDINNYHFGVVGKAYGFFTEEFMLRTAGQIEMDKWKDDYKKGKRPTPEVPASWRPLIQVYKYSFSTGGGTVYKETVLDAPYGDNPTDHDWIKKGFQYYKTHRKELDGDWW